MELNLVIFEEALSKSPLSVQHTARALFDRLDPNLDPQVAFLAVPWDGKSKSLLVGTENCKCSVGWFEGIRGALDEIPESWLTSLAPDVRGVIWQQKVNIKVAIQNTLHSKSEVLGHVSFATFPEFMHGYCVCMVLQLSKAAIESHYSLSRNVVRHPHETSLIHEAAIAFVRRCQSSLERLSQGLSVFVLGIKEDQVLRTAGFWLMRTPEQATQSPAAGSLFHACNAISSLRYEGTEGSGRMIVSRQGHPNVEVMIRLLNPVSLSNYRGIRKLLCDSSVIHGLGRCNELRYDEGAEDLFTVDFTSHHTWKLLHAGHEMMVVSYGQPSLPKRPIDEEDFKARIRREFVDLDNKSLMNLWEVVHQAANQKHGTMIVVSDKADEECKRLATKSTPIKPIRLSPELMLPLSSIDGAILIEPDTTCHAIGVILDGMASDRGDPARGARYNSAIRYIDYVRAQNHSCLIVVVSEDGMIDLF